MGYLERILREHHQEVVTLVRELAEARALNEQQRKRIKQLELRMQPQQEEKQPA